MNGRINLSCGKEAMTSTSISDYFIDNCLAAAHGSFVKVYLYLIRCLHDTSMPISVEEMSNRVGESENDVIKALKYWEKEGFLRVSYDADGDVRDIRIENSDGFPVRDKVLTVSEPPVRGTRTASRVTQIKSCIKEESESQEAEIIVPTYTPSQISRFKELDDFSQLIDTLEQKLGKTMTVKMLQLPSFLYESLGFTPELIEYLYDYCINAGKTSDRYIEKTAIEWKKSGIFDLDSARMHVMTRTEEYSTVINSFGIVGRRLGSSELEYLSRWHDSGFSIELIREACDRSVLKGTGGKQFSYADSILKNWMQKGITTIEEVRNDDASFRQSNPVRKSVNEQNAPKRQVSKGRFTNFPQRNYSNSDLAEFERRKLSGKKD
ncbi:MAG: DnaD domain protein [Lachnospiraceae bacterium]|nr:DnaD domain protein [Lachnospiraceae bacterium]